MNNINIRIFDKTRLRSVKIELPASYEHIEDVFDKLGTRENINADCDIAFDFGVYVESIELANVDLFELNHLAERIQNFDLVEAFEMQGAVLKFRETNLSAGELINIVENIKEGNIEAYPAANVAELAETYIEFAMIPEIANLQKDSNSWVLEHLDYEKVGENIRQKTGGVFAGQAFVVVGELEKLYSGDYPRLSPNNHVFKLEVGYKDESDDGSRMTIPLPTDMSNIEKMMYVFEVDDLDSLNCYKFESIVPTLELMDFEMEDIYDLNSLASSINFFRQNNELQTFKAVVNALEVIDLERVVTASGLVSEFELKTDMRTEAEYCRSKLSVNLPHDLYEYIDVDDYGRKLIKNDGASVTDYGVLVPKDGICLAEKMGPTMQQQIDDIDKGIDDIKKSFANQWQMTNAQTFDLLTELGGLQSLKNGLTGNNDDIQCIYSDDGEFLRYVAGFVGEESNTQDLNGDALCVGDVVRCENGFERMVILNCDGEPMLPQNYLSQEGAVKTLDHTELDMDKASSVKASCTVISCLERYLNEQQQSYDMEMSM